MTERLARVAHLFPLIPRPRPAPLPADQRIAEITQLAATPTDHPDYASRVAAAHNRAALLASDLGDAEFARALCWAHHDRYTDQRPWDAVTARRAVEPLINLARLHIRVHQPDAAVNILESLLHATRHVGTAQVDHRPVHLSQDVLTTSEARQELHRWLWTVTVADGIRALARADRWDDALAHAHVHRGIGDTLLDGRQTVVIAHALRGEHTEARRVLDTSAVQIPWQQAVHACLRLAVQNPGTPTDGYSEARLNLINTCQAQPHRFREHLLQAFAGLCCTPLDDRVSHRQGLRQLPVGARSNESAELRELLRTALDTGPAAGLTAAGDV